MLNFLRFFNINWLNWGLNLILSVVLLYFWGQNGILKSEIKELENKEALNILQIKSCEGVLESQNEAIKELKKAPKKVNLKAIEGVKGGGKCEDNYRRLFEAVK